MVHITGEVALALPGIEIARRQNAMRKAKGLVIYRETLLRRFAYP